MKQIFFSLLLSFISMTVFAQNNAKDIEDVEEVNFYGVDFSKARAYGIKESPSTFKEGLCCINDLFVSEPQKYDFGKILAKDITDFCFEATRKNNDGIDMDKFISFETGGELTTCDIQNLINELECKKTKKTGVVFIAESLNKVEVKATYIVVFFNEENKKILYSKKVSGKAGGFGVRNYWAASIRNSLKKWVY